MISKRSGTLLAVSLLLGTLPASAGASVQNNVSEFNLAVVLPENCSIGDTITPTLLWGSSHKQGLSYQWYSIDSKDNYSLIGTEQDVILNAEALGDITGILCLVITDDGSHIESNICSISSNRGTSATSVESTEDNEKERTTYKKEYYKEFLNNRYDFKSSTDTPVVAGNTDTFKSVTNDATRLLDNMLISNSISNKYIHSVLSWYLQNNDITASVNIVKKIPSTYTKAGVVEGTVVLTDSLGVSTQIEFNRVIPMLEKQAEENFELTSSEEKYKATNNMADTKTVPALGLACVAPILKKRKRSEAENDEEDSSMSEKEKLLDFLSGFQADNDTSVVKLFKKCNEVLQGSDLTLQSKGFKRVQATEFNEGSIKCGFDLTSNGEIIDSITDFIIPIPKLKPSLQSLAVLVDDYFENTFVADNSMSEDSIAEIVRGILGETDNDITIKIDGFFAKQSTELEEGSLACNIILTSSKESNSLVVDVKAEIKRKPLTLDSCKTAIRKYLLSLSVNNDTEISLDGVLPETADVEILSQRVFPATELREGTIVLNVAITLKEGDELVAHQVSFIKEIPELEMSVSLIKSKVESTLLNIVIPSSVTLEQLLLILPKGINIKVGVEDLTVADGACSGAIVISDADNLEEEMIIFNQPTVDLPADLASGIISVQNIICDKAFNNDTDLDTLVDLIECTLPSGVGIKAVPQIVKATYADEGVYHVDFTLTEGEDSVTYTLNRGIPVIEDSIKESKSKVTEIIKSLDFTKIRNNSIDLVAEIKKGYNNSSVNIDVVSLEYNSPSFETAGSVVADLKLSNVRYYTADIHYEAEVPVLTVSSLEDIKKIMEPLLRGIVIKDDVFYTDMFEQIDALVPEGAPFTVVLDNDTFNMCKASMVYPMVYREGGFNLEVQIIYNGDSIGVAVPLIIEKLPLTVENVMSAVNEFFNFSEYTDKLYTFDSEKLKEALIGYLALPKNSPVLIEVDTVSSTVPSYTTKGSFSTAVSVIEQKTGISEETVINREFDRLEYTEEELYSQMSALVYSAPRLYTETGVYTALKTLLDLPADRDTRIEFKSIEAEGNRVIHVHYTIDGNAYISEYPINASLTYAELLTCKDQLQDYVSDYLFNKVSSIDTDNAITGVAEFIKNPLAVIQVYNFFYDPATFDADGMITFDLEVVFKEEGIDDSTFSTKVKIVVKQLELTLEESIKRVKHRLGAYFATVDTVGLTADVIKSKIELAVEDYKLIEVEVNLEETLPTAYETGLISGSYKLYDANSDTDLSTVVPVKVKTELSAKQKLDLVAEDIKAELSSLNNGVLSSTEVSDVFKKFTSLVEADCSNLIVTPARTGSMGSVTGKAIISLVDDSSFLEKVIDINVTILRSYEQIEAFIDSYLENVKTQVEYDNLINNIEGSVVVNSNVDIVSPTEVTDGRIEGSLELKSKATVDSKIFDIDIVLLRSAELFKASLEKSLEDVTSVDEFNALISDLQEVDYLTVVNSVKAEAPTLESNGVLQGSILLKSYNSATVEINKTLYRSAGFVAEWLNLTLTDCKSEEQFNECLEALNSEIKGDSVVKVDKRISIIEPDISKLGSIIGVIIVKDSVSGNSYTIDVGIPLVSSFKLFEEEVQSAIKDVQNINELYSIFNKLKEDNSDMKFTINVDEFYTETGDKGCIVGNIGVYIDEELYNIPVLVNMVLPTKPSQEG